MKCKLNLDESKRFLWVTAHAGYIVATSRDLSDQCYEVRPCIPHMHPLLHCSRVKSETFLFASTEYMSYYKTCSGYKFVSS